MKNIDIPLRSKVFSGGILMGTSRYVILDPANCKVTHLVVRPDNTTYFKERLIPIQWVRQAFLNEIDLSVGIKEFEQAELFIETKSASELQHLLGNYSINYPLWPAVPSFNMPLVLNKKVPKGELAVQHETEVLATNGNVGYLDEFVVSVPNYRILELILRNGRLLGKKDIAVPAANINQIAEDGTILLDLDKEAVDLFPEVDLHTR